MLTLSFLSVMRLRMSLLGGRRGLLSSFSSPEAAILLVSNGDRDLWLGPTPEVRDSRTYRHSAHA